MKRITVPYFSNGLKLTTPITLGVGIFLLIRDHPVWAAVLIVLSIIVLTTKYVTEIDLTKKEYRDFLSFLWLPFDEETYRFKLINKIVIARETHSQMLNSRAGSRKLDWTSFTGTLILDGNKQFDLLTRNDKTELARVLKEYAIFLKTDIEDQSSIRHYTVDLSQIG